MKTRLLKSSRITTSIISMFYRHVGEAFVAVSDFLNLEHVKSFYRKSCYSFNHFMNEQALSPYKFGNHCTTSTSIIADQFATYFLPWKIYKLTKTPLMGYLFYVEHPSTMHTIKPTLCSCFSLPWGFLPPFFISDVLAADWNSFEVSRRLSHSFEEK